MTSPSSTGPAKQDKPEAAAPDLETTAGKIQDLKARRKRLVAGGGEKAIAKRHEDGKITARERLDILLDQGTFQEMYLHRQHRSVNFGMGGKELPADGVVTGAGLIDGRPVYVASQDFTVAGGSLGRSARGQDRRHDAGGAQGRRALHHD